MGNDSELADKKKNGLLPGMGSFGSMFDGISFSPPEYLTEKFNGAKDGLSNAWSEFTSPPEYNLEYSDAGHQNTDSQFGEFSNSNKQGTTAAGIDYNAPNFDPSTMKDYLPDTEFKGAGTAELGQAMEMLYGEPTEEEITQALGMIQKARGSSSSIDELRAQYDKAMSIKEAGQQTRIAALRAEGKSEEEIEETLAEGEFKEGDLAEGGKHYGFAGSTGQLRFGMIMGDVFDVDPVFGSLISPTGGAVGPGDNSISGADPNNATVLHGTVHDAAGYLLTHHGLGPGYNYLDDPWEFFDSSNPLAGQSSGTSYFADRSQVNNGVSTLLTILKNIPEHGLDFNGNAIHSSVEVAEGNGITGVTDWAGDKINGAAGWLGDKWEGAKGLAGDAWEGAKNTASGVGGWLGDKWEGAKGLAGDAWSGAKDTASGIGGWMGDKWEGAKGLAGDAWGSAQDTASDVGGWMSDKWDGAKETAGGLMDRASNTANDVGGWMGDKWEGAKGLAGDAWSGTKNAVGQGASWAGDKVDDVKQGASGLWGGIKDTWGKIQAKDEKQDYGSKPVGDGVWGPYAHAGSDEGSVSAGFGAFGDRVGNTWTNFLFGEGSAGAMKQEDGSTSYGMTGNVGVAKGEVDFIDLINQIGGPGTAPEELIAKLELGAGTAAVDAWFNPENGFSLGAQANAGEGALSFGTQGTGNQDKMGRFGLSAGAGAAARGHWGDSDNDGFREYGFGFDAGPVSMDIKSEDPLRDIIMPMAVPGLGALVAPWINPEENLTYQATDAISGLASDAWEGGQNLWSGAKETAGNAADWAGNKWDSAKETAGNAADWAGNKWDSAKETAGNAADWAGNKIDSAKGLASDAWVGAKKAGGQAVDWAGKKAGAAKGYAKDKWKDAKGLAGSAYGGTKSMAKKGWNKFKSLF